MKNRLRYSLWANSLYIKLLEENPGITEASRLMAHILAAQEIWNARIAGRKAQIPVWPDLSKDDLRIWNERVYEKAIQLWSAHLPEKIISYANTKGEKFENTVLEILDHTINHATHHRAQVAVFARQAGIIPPVSDMIVFFRTQDFKH